MDKQNNTQHNQVKLTHPRYQLKRNLWERAEGKLLVHVHFFVRQQTHLCLLQQLPSAGRQALGRQASGDMINLLRSIMFVCNVPRSKRASFFFVCVILGIFLMMLTWYLSFLFWFLLDLLSMNISLSLFLSLFLQFCNFCKSFCNCSLQLIGKRSLTN